MAYNPFYSFQNYSPYQQNYQGQTPGFVSVRSIEEAYNWPIAPGNSITFKIETAPYICVKTKGFSPMEPPVFERYRLVKEEDTPPAQEAPAAEKTRADDNQITALWEEVKALRGEIDALKAKPKKPAKKGGAIDDTAESADATDL